MSRALLVVTETDDFVNAHLFRRAAASWCQASGWVLDTIAVEASERLARELGPVAIPATGGEVLALPRADGQTIARAVDAAAEQGGEYEAALFFGFSGYLMRYLARVEAERVLVYDAHVLRGVEALQRSGGVEAMRELLRGVEVVCPYHEEFGEQYEAIGVARERVRFVLQPVDEEYLGAMVGLGGRGGGNGNGDGDGDGNGDGGPATPEPKAKAGEGYVAVPGENSRDFGVLAEAVNGLGAEVRVAAGGGEIPELQGAGVTELPRLSYRDYCGLIAGASVVALPVKGENAGLLSLSLAMMLGRAAVITGTRFSAPYVDDGVNGLRVPAGNAGALRDALARLLGDAALRERLGAAARAQALKRQSLGALLDTMLG